jgi:para-aminobenzoate synthetase component 1
MAEEEMLLQPLVHEIEFCEPLEVLGIVGVREGLVLLDSAMANPALGRWSWLAPDPCRRFTWAGGQASWNEIPTAGSPAGPTAERLEGHPAHALRRQLKRFADVAPDKRLPFAGGATGFFAYEAGRLFERLPEPKWRDGRRRPDIDLYFHDVGIAFDVIERRAFIVSNGLPEDDPLKRGRRIYERAEWLKDKLERGAARRPNAPIVLPRDGWQSNMGAGEYQAAVERTRRYIADGDIFQANITQAWRAKLPFDFDPLVLYRQLREANPAPFGAFIATPERLIASTSPEGFLLLQDGEAETRPIKGTRRRSADPLEDRRLAEELLASEKDRAENIMIVDLMRNDFSRVCRPGSVKAPVLCGLESYASVHHLTSVVRGRLKPGLDALHLMAACFPGGSITGAPKIRAMEIIHELEPEPRRIYCGSIVHFGFDGSLRSNIAIRTLTVEDGVAKINAGGGITLLSDPEEEYAEALIKAERMFQAFEPARAAESAA